MSYDIREASFLKAVLKYLNYHVHKKGYFIDLRTENNKLIYISKDELISKNSKHIRVNHYLIRDHAQSGTNTETNELKDTMTAETCTKKLLFVNF